MSRRVLLILGAISLLAAVSAAMAFRDRPAHTCNVGGDRNACTCTQRIDR